jgi:acetyl coenzyme A synthetase (ADP forming)-like protein
VRPEASRYAADALLRDGSSVHVRALRPDDKTRLLDHFRRLGPESIRYRFFGVKAGLTDEELRYFTELDFVRHVGLAAVRREAGEERFYGVARYIRTDDLTAEGRAEFAVAVDDAHQGLGIGTVLLERLVDIALRSGITAFEADVLGDNRRMHELLTHLGLSVASSGAAGVVHVTFPTERTPAFVQAQEQRAWHGSAESLKRLLHPRSVAVVGASRRPGTLGNRLLANIKDGYTGGVFPVNPGAGEVLGLRAYPSVKAIGAPIDLGIVAVPAPAVQAAVADLAEAGAKGVVVISSGFAEVSEAGAEAQRRLRALARASGMRLVGPNCMGVINTDPEVRLNATFTPVAPTPGNVGFLSQSGALGVAVLDYARALNLGVSTFVSVGNKADVSGNDLLAYWRDDPHTRVVALYLESFGNPRRFALLAPEVARDKPIVAVKAGRSAAGTRAAQSHSAALACVDVAVDALFEQAGVIRTETLEDLFDVVALLATQPVPGGPRVGVVTNAGGPGILFADACETRGLALPELGSESVASLRAFLPAEASLRNPVDIIASAVPEDYERAIATVGRDPGIDAVVVIFVPPVVTRAEEVAAAIARAAGAVPEAKPVLTVFLSSKGAPPMLAAGRRGRLPSYSFPENAARALAAAVRYGSWRSRPRGSALVIDAATRAAIRAVVASAMAGRDGPIWLPPEDVATVLRALGIGVTRSAVTTLDEARRAADGLGYPLVAKAVAPGLVHKSDLGGVILGLTSAVDVAAAVDLLRKRMAAAGHPLDRVLLQREVQGGIEALVGVVSDPTFGPLLVCGLGGVQVELLRDASVRLPPVTDLDAEEMIDRLRLRPLLDGYRGSPPGDRPALVSLIQRVSALIEALPELQEMDLNPVKVLRPGEGVVAVDARIRVGPAPLATA